MKKVSNVNIPFNSLHNWLKGYSNSINDKLDNSGRLVSTEFKIGRASCRERV